MNNYINEVSQKIADAQLDHTRAMHALQQAEQKAKTEKALSEQRVQELVEAHVREHLVSRNALPGAWKGSS